MGGLDAVHLEKVSTSASACLLVKKKAFAWLIVRCGDCALTDKLS